MNYPFSMVCALLGVVFMYLVFQSLPEGEQNHKVSKRMYWSAKKYSGCLVVSAHVSCTGP